MVLQFSAFLLLMAFFSCISSKVDEFASNSGTNIKSSLYIGDPQNEIKLNKYFDLMELDILISELCEKYSTIVKVTTLGQSAVDNITIRAVEISHDVQEKRKLLKPMVKFVANKHSDDGVAYALMVSLIQYLVYSDGYENRITDMLNTTDIYIVPTFNMDSLRRSAQTGYSKFLQKSEDMGNYKNSGKEEFDNNVTRQQELWDSQAFINDNPFVISANIQDGTSIVSCYEARMGTVENKDNALLAKLAKDYAELNSMMKTKSPTVLERSFLKKKASSMRDYNYYHSNCFEIKLNISNSKNVSESELPNYWCANLESMLKFIQSVHQGVYGIVKDQEGKPVKRALIQVKGNGKIIKSTEEGEYWRLLLPLGPGEFYNITTSAVGYGVETKSVAVTEDDPYVRVDFILKHLEVYGMVQDKNPFSNILQPVKEAVIKVKGFVHSIKVNEDGKYSKLLMKQQLYYITAKAPGYQKETKLVFVTQDAPSGQVDFVLKQQGVYGVVNDMNGDPVKNAVIKKDNHKYIVDIIFPFCGIKRELEQGTVHVNEKGEYSMPLLGMGQHYKLTVSAPGYQTITKSVTATREEPYVGHNFKLKKT